jgi:hypothetical protein
VTLVEEERFATYNEWDPVDPMITGNTRPEYGIQAYSPILDAFVSSSTHSSTTNPVTADYGGFFRLYYIGHHTAGVTLGSICEDVANWVGIAPNDYNFNALDQVVSGWNVTRGQAENMIAPLLAMYDSDIRLNGFVLEGIKRGGTSEGTISSEDFIETDPRYVVKVAQPIELPKSLIVNFSDTLADLLPNAAMATRPLDTTTAEEERSIQMNTWATTPAIAAQYTNRMFRRIWNSDLTLDCTLQNDQYALLPGDVKTLTLDGEIYGFYFTRLIYNFGDDVIEASAVYDATSLALLDGAAGASFDAHTPDVVMYIKHSTPVVLDIPYIKDVDATTNPILYFMTGPVVGEGVWVGSIFFQRLDGQYTEELDTFITSEQMTWGIASGILNATVDPAFWDHVSELTIVMASGTLTSITEVQADANMALNLAYIAGEIVQFLNATDRKSVV